MSEQLHLVDDEEPEEEHCCSPENWDLIQNGLFYAVPAPTHAEITERMGVVEWKERWCVGHLRKNAAEHGWTILHAPRGPNPSGRDRFISVLADSEGEPYADSDTRLAVGEGLDDTLDAIAAMADNQGFGLRLFKPYLEHPVQQRQVARVIRALRNLSEEAHDARETGIGWADGANGG